jgi:hypothetical protein
MQNFNAYEVISKKKYNNFLNYWVSDGVNFGCVSARCLPCPKQVAYTQYLKPQLVQSEINNYL